MKVTLRLFSGPVEPKEALRRTFGARKDDAGRAALVTENGSDVARLRALLVDEAERAVVSPPIFSLVGLAASLVNAGGGAYRWLSAAEKERLVWELLADGVRAGQLARLASIAGFNGTPKAVTGTLTAIRRSAVDTAEAARLLEQAGEVEGELGALLVGYEDALRKHSLLDTEEALLLGARALRRGEVSLPFARVVGFDFSRLSVAELRFLRDLAAADKEVEVLVAYAAHPAFTEEAERLKSVAAMVGEVAVEWAQPPDDQGGQSVQGARGDLAGLMAGLLAAGKPRLEVLAAPSRRREVLEAAARIRRLGEEDGIALPDIAVLVSDLGLYRPLLEDIFPQAGIGLPGAALSAGQARAVAGALLLLELPLLDWPRRQTLEALAAGPWGLPARAVWRLDRLTRSAGVVKGWDDWADFLGGGAEAGMAAAALLGRLHDGLESARAQASVSAVAREVLRLLRQSHAFARVAQGHRRLSSGGAAERGRLLESYALEVGGWREFEQCLEELSGDPPWGVSGISAGSDAYGDLLVLLRSSLAERAVRVGQAFAGGLSGRPEITEARRVSASSLAGFRAVLVLGALEREFPRPRSSTWVWGRVSDEAYRRGVAAPELDPAAADAMALLEISRTPREFLFFSYPFLDADEKETLASPFLRQVREAARVAGLPVSEVRIAPAAPATGAGTLQPAPPTNDGRPSDAPANVAGVEGLDLLGRRYRDGFRFSASRLGEYGRCPFFYLCRHELRLEPLEEPSGDISPAEMGELYHEVLWRFFTAHRGRPLDPAARRRYREEMAGYLKDVADAMAAARPATFREAWKARSREAERYLFNLIDGELADLGKTGDGARPLFFELAFGLGDCAAGRRDPASTAAPLLVRNSTGKQVALSGKIDRVDVGDGGVFVIYDYKSGSGHNDLHPLDACRAGIDFQLPVYLLAANVLFPERLAAKKAGGAAFYRLPTGERTEGIWHERARAAVDLGQRRKGILPDEEWDGLLRAAAEWMVGYAESVAAGRFPVEPKLCREECPYRALCGRPKRTGVAGEAGAEGGVGAGAWGNAIPTGRDEPGSGGGERSV